MSRLNKGKNLPTKKLLKRKTNPKVLKNLALGLVLALVAALIYIKVSPFTHDAKTRIKLEQTIIQSQSEKEKLVEEVQKSGSESELQKKQIEDLNKKLQETEKALEAKRGTQKAYAASLKLPGDCAAWKAQAGIPNTHATNTLINNESGCKTWAVNPTSGACGIPQAYPCSKLPCPLDNSGAVCQLTWMKNYVADRYGSWESALSAWYSRCGSPQGCWY